VRCDLHALPCRSRLYISSKLYGSALFRYYYKQVRE
jgi:hypothetical protein